MVYFKPIGNGRNCFIPADLLKLIFASLANALHRVQQAIGLFSQRRMERPRRQARAWKSSSPVLSASIYCTLPSLECH